MNLLSYSRLRNSETDKRRQDGNLSFDYRSPIESDYGRLVFSSAFRRLHDKTQVFPLTENDNIHSRLTHSMEVASVGKSFAVDILKNQKIKDSIKNNLDDTDLWRSLTALIEVICLAHDIGNPPLGHFGETAIKCYFTSLFKQIKEDLECHGDITKCSNPIIVSEVAKCHNEEERNTLRSNLMDFVSGENNLQLDYTQFDGNAEGFRVLTKLQFLNDLYGLNLTSASLASILKYPNTGKKNKDVLRLHKHGVFVTEAEEMKIVMENCGIGKADDNSYYRHPLSYLMEAADTICYSLMDLEDAVSKGWLSYHDIVELLKNTDGGKEVTDEAGSHFVENDPSKKKVVQLRTELMSYLVKDAFDVFSKNYDAILSGTHNIELLENNKVCNAINKHNKRKIFTRKEIENLELTGNQIITGLLDYYVKYLFNEEESIRMHCKHIISKAVFMTTLQEHENYFGTKRKAWNIYDDFDPKDLSYEEKFRIIRDHVACMTDKYALEQFRRLSGQRI